jgi:D-alanyl-D-alanine carboxypeptidase
MKKKIALSLITGLIIAATPAMIFASKDSLLDVYSRRGDLQELFDKDTFKAIPGKRVGFILDLYDWAERYGYKEHIELLDFAPSVDEPVRVNPAEVESQIGAEAYVVMDKKTGKILTVKKENLEWPIASLTKLITADVVLLENVSMAKRHGVLNSDNVGGAKLNVYNGDTFSVDDLFYATLVGSANNAANALSRTIGVSRSDFIKKMNERAKDMNLVQTKFVDPTGIEVENVSTPLEMARIARTVFKNEKVQKYTTTSVKYVDVLNRGTQKKMTNTNWMLWKPAYDDVYVTGGKTGFLYESGWNLAVALKPSKNDERELLIVLFGGTSRAESFNDAKRLASWAWKAHKW